MGSNWRYQSLMLKSLFAASCFLALFGAASMAEDLTNKLGLYQAAGMIPAAVVAADWDHSRPVLISTEQPAVASGTSFTPTINVPSDCTLVVIALGAKGPMPYTNIDYDTSTMTLNGYRSEDVGSASSTENIRGYLGAMILSWPTSVVGTGSMSFNIGVTSASVDVWSCMVYYFKNATGILTDSVSADYWPGYQHLTAGHITSPEPIKCVARPMSRFPVFVGLCGRDTSVASGTWSPGNQTQIGSTQGTGSFSFTINSTLDAARDGSRQTFTWVSGSGTAHARIAEIINVNNGVPVVYGGQFKDYIATYKAAATLLDLNVPIGPPPRDSKPRVLYYVIAPFHKANVVNVSVAGLSGNLTLIVPAANSTSLNANQIVAYSRFTSDITDPAPNLYITMDQSCQFNSIRGFSIYGLASDTPVDSQYSANLTATVTRSNVTVQTPRNSVQIFSGAHAAQTHAYAELADGSANSDVQMSAAGGGVAADGAGNSTTIYLRNQHTDSNTTCTVSLRSLTAAYRTLVGTSWR